MKRTFLIPLLTCLHVLFSSTPALGEITRIQLEGRQLFLNGEASTLRGVCYNPVPKGKKHPDNITITPSSDDLKKVEKDFQLMKDAGINTVRTYAPILDKRVLDLMSRYGIFQIVPVLNSNLTSMDKVRSIVNTLKDHPSTLMWQVGNEWNYNKLYDDSLDFEGAKDLVKDVGALIKSLDSSHPLSTDYGEMPSQSLVEELSDFDIWGLNIYAGKSFGDRFERWKEISDKPMYVGEFGADAINVDKVDLKSQATATRELLDELKSNLSSRSPDHAALGGSIFAWVDGWWKDNGGSPSKQEIGGNAPGGGPFPDGILNEEFWGVLTIDREIRPAYNELKKAWKEVE